MADDAKTAIASMVDASAALGQGAADAQAAAAAGPGETAAAATKNIEAINAVLLAIATGQANETALAENKELNATVAALAKSVPGLAADLAALSDAASAPSVSNLILEREHQRVLQRHAKARIALSERRIEILKARFNKLFAAHVALQEFRFALCNYAVLSNGRPHPGSDCKKFSVKVEQKKGVEKTKPPEAHFDVVCKLGTDEVKPCALKDTWREAFDARPTASGDAAGPLKPERIKRALYSAVLYHVEAFEAERALREASFRLVDLDHREAVATQRRGIEAMSNLVASPLDQLAAYHASGIKPEAVADAVSTAAGLIAIGIGVAQ